MSASGDPPASLTAIAGIVGGILVLAVILFAQVLFYNVQRIEDDTKRYAGKPQELADLEARQLAQINAYRYVDQTHGVVAIPIDRAMELYATAMQSPPPPTTIPSTDRRSPATTSSGPAR
jgi:hypothetical protein